MDLAERYRDRFPILRDTTYLINHSLAAMPAAAEERLLEYARTWKTRGIRSWGEGWWEMPLTVGDQIGRIIGAPPGSVVMHQNVTIAEAIVLSCFRPTPERNRIVYEEANFPSVRYPLTVLCPPCHPSKHQAAKSPSNAFQQRERPHLEHHADADEGVECDPERRDHERGV